MKARFSSHLKNQWHVLKESASEFSNDNAPRLGAAIAYYTVFSLAPLLIISIAVAGLVFGEQATRGELVGQMQGLVGASGAQAIQTMLQNAHRPGSGLIAGVIGALTLLFGASGVFTELQSSLNTIWNVRAAKSQGFKNLIRSRVLSFAMILGIAFLLLVSLLVSALISALGEYFEHLLPGGAILWQGVDIAVSLGITALLFAMIFKILPDAKIAWRDVWTGSFVTAFLFAIGKFGIGLYLGRASVGGVYGAAGSLVIVLVWVYYSAQIFLFGAEYTKVYAHHHGSQRVPEDHALVVTRLPSRGKAG